MYQMGVFILLTIICSFPVISVSHLHESNLVSDLSVIYQPDSTCKLTATGQVMFRTPTIKQSANAVILESAGTCQSGWPRFDKTCYFFSTIAVSWSDARESCVVFGGHLVIITSEEEHRFIIGKKPPLDYWIGLTDMEKEGSWQWVDNSPLGAFNRWEALEPSSSGGNEDCVEMYKSGRWNDAACKTILRYICEIEEGTCQTGWHHFGSNCYHFSGIALSWSNARQSCIAADSQLVIISSDSEQRFITGKTDSVDYWIGLTDMENEGSWRWVNNRMLIGFTNWEVYEPNQAGDEDCAQIFNKYGRWNDVDCGKLFRYICQK